MRRFLTFAFAFVLGASSGVSAEEKAATLVEFNLPPGSDVQYPKNRAITEIRVFLPQSVTLLSEDEGVLFDVKKNGQQVSLSMVTFNEQKPSTVHVRVIGKNPVAVAEFLDRSANEEGIREWAIPSRDLSVTYEGKPATVFLRPCARSVNPNRYNTEVALVDIEGEVEFRGIPGKDETALDFRAWKPGNEDGFVFGALFVKDSSDEPANAAFRLTPIVGGHTKLSMHAVAGTSPSHIVLQTIREMKIVSQGKEILPEVREIGLKRYRYNYTIPLDKEKPVKIAVNSF